MPFHIEQAELAAEGLDLAAVHAALLVQAVENLGLRDGRDHVVRIRYRNPVPNADNPNQVTVAVNIHHWLAAAAQAHVGETVYGSVLTADWKADNELRFEATPNGMRFEPHADGWLRVS